MRHYSRLVGVASVLVLASAFVIAPLTAGAFWDGFPFGKPGIGSGSSSGIQTGPVTLCPRTITAAGISVNVFIPNKRGCDTPPPPPPPPPVDECPNVPGTQAEGPCADEECVEDGGTWDGDSCEFPEPEEPTLDFSATPPTIQQGASSTLEWDSDNADTCTASDGWSGTKSLDGSQIVSPSATTTYMLTCVGEGGTTTESVTVGVILPPEEPEEPTLEFTADPQTINQGATSTLEWESFNADSCTASDGWSGSKTLTGSQEVSPSATTTYTLTCEGDGGEVEESVTVGVILPQELEGALLITEVLYDLTTTTSQGVESANEWVEIHNGTNANINLSNYTIVDASSTDILPDVVLPAGAYAVIVASSTTVSFWSIPAEAVVVQLTNVTIGNGLGNGGDMVSLFDEVASTTVDAVSWGTNTTAFSPSVPTVDVNTGHSIARTDDTIDTDSAADWEELETPTPGE